MSIHISSTDDMDGAIRSLAERHQNVLVLRDYRCINPIRMRDKLLLDLNLQWALSWKRGADVLVENWRRDGGVMLYRSNPINKRPFVPVCDAIMFIETPLQMDYFEYVCQSARREIVVYKPPSWQLHEKTVAYRYPQREDFILLESILDSLEFVTKSEIGLRAVAASKFERAGVFTEDDIFQLTGWEPIRLKYLLFRYKHLVHRWHPYTMRFTPDDSELKWGWDLLKTQPEFDHRVHALKFNVIYPLVLGFKTMLRQLIRHSHIEAEEKIYVVNCDRRTVDFEAFDAVNNMRRGKWFALRNFVDNLPEYSI